MNLTEVFDSLGENDILTGLDIGVHGNCEIDSNCPIAIELRRVVMESGITLQQLADGVALHQTRGDDNTFLQNPEIQMPTDEISFLVFGHSISIPLSEVIGNNIRTAVFNRMQELRDADTTLERIGQAFHNTYREKVAALSKNKRLQQVAFDPEELRRTGCQVTATEGNYLFIFPFDYHAEYIVNNGIRHELSAAHKAQIARLGGCMTIEITNENKFTFAKAKKADFTPMNHYHASHGGNCWGSVTIPRTWNGTLRQVYALFKELEGSLMTINNNSLFNRHPEGMPESTSILRSATRLGREGDLRPEAEVPEQPDAGDVEEPGWVNLDAPRTWGRRET